MRMLALLLTLACLAPSALHAQSQLFGTVLDPNSSPVAGARLQLLDEASKPIATTISDSQGHFVFPEIQPGPYKLSASASPFSSVTMTFTLAPNEQKSLTLQFTQLVSVFQSITILANSPSSLTPDPSQTVVVHDQVLDGNPGRPGAPISIPGLPIENHLPLGLQARGEFEFVRAKPLGDGFTGVPVYETRGALLRPFAENRMSVAVNFLIAKGYTGQTTETIPTYSNCAIECAVGVPLKSFVALTYIYFFSHLP
jgi:hypothetical protein